jgi:hypothetical protein
MAAADGVERLLAEVGAWRAYLTLAVRVATWRADYEALQVSEGHVIQGAGNVLRVDRIYMALISQPEP